MADVSEQAGRMPGVGGGEVKVALLRGPASSAVPRPEIGVTLVVNARGHIVDRVGTARVP